MEPSLNWPFNVRSFFTDREKKDIGGGITLWRGYFQSVRPAINQMLINIDISTGAMYKEGPLVNLCMEFMGRQGDARIFSPRSGFPDRERVRLQHFLSGIRVTTAHTTAGGRPPRPRVVKRLSKQGSRDLSFTAETGQTTVADYFRRLLNRPLQYPDVICVEVCVFALMVATRPYILSN